MSTPPPAAWHGQHTVGSHVTSAARTASRTGRLQAHANTAVGRHGGEAPAKVATGAQTVGSGSAAGPRSRLSWLPPRRVLSLDATPQSTPHPRDAQSRRNTAAALQGEQGGEVPTTAVAAAPGGNLGEQSLTKGTTATYLRLTTSQRRAPCRAKSASSVGTPPQRRGESRELSSRRAHRRGCKNS